MLTNNVIDVDLNKEKEKLYPFLPNEVKPYYLENKSKETEIDFPVNQYPTKIKSLNLDKTPTYKGKLKGIKGQYLIFENGTVFNVRNWEGYVVEFNI